jgi:TRAP-type mannitol/chloroaromatic compound transport system permease small subunit
MTGRLTRLLGPWVRWIEALSEWLGRAMGWLCTVLMLVVVAYVVGRYCFSYSAKVLEELQWHLFTLIFLLGAGYTLRHGRHVRVDVLYSRGSPRVKAAVDLAGVLLFLLPFCGVLIWFGYGYAQHSLWRGGAWQFERDAGEGVLPTVGLLKAVLPLAMGLLSLQGLALAARSLLTLLGVNTLPHEAEPPGEHL